jgi:hypothetical protein
VGFSRDKLHIIEPEVILTHLGLIYGSIFEHLVEAQLRALIYEEDVSQIAEGRPVIVDLDHVS